MGDLPWFLVLAAVPPKSQPLADIHGGSGNAKLPSGRGEQVRLSQLALSVQIRQLERDLGVPLFHRTTLTVNLTEEGHRLYAVVKRFRADITQVAAELKGQAALQQDVVTIAVMPSLATVLFPRS